ncbi:hypothetical protein HIM_10634 [Hirsutella minnesotensis 3608]|uniref:Uncharacterized protein n=1 Tax=Hirsutella minnesotensis 3608 TaxID=1043627 RepID=A0A0F8A223_9HYPO|nr:hypothetical protein HIM_10634 [Hirsutella minnesotensis 3608]
MTDNQQCGCEIGSRQCLVPPFYIRLLDHSNEQDADASCSDRDQLLSLLPASYRKESGDLAAVSRFQAIKNLRYGAPQHSLRLGRFTFELLDSNGTPLQKASSGKYEVLEGQELVVSFVDNEHSQPVHISIFNLNATWGVEKLHPGDGQDSEETLADKPVRVDVRMEIPGGTNADPPEIDDIIRAFIYTGEHPPSWDELILPNLPAESSQVFPDLPVEAVLFAPDLPENPLGSRQMKVRRQQERGGQWAVLDFVVRTSRSYAGVVTRNG